MKLTTRLFISFLSVIIITFLSCKNPCSDTVDPPYRAMSIVLEDNQGKNLLDSLYIEDFYEFIESQTDRKILAQRVFISENSYLVLGFESTLQNTDYYISWDANNTDTLSFQWDTIDKECFDSYILTEAKHNNLEIGFDLETDFEDVKITLIQ